ncbi:YgiQ family radical SAM protein [bacterium]|nr:YgiQ family radical SAM protein [bacterium]
MINFKFLPTTSEELKYLGWKQLDVILVCGDTYIDSPFIGVAVIGKVLLAHGYKVGIIAQPDIASGDDISRLGEPRLFWGITSGNVDSMVSNYTASKKRRKKDDFTPGGVNDRRPDRALIVYANLIRRYFKDTVPLILGGIEASLRRTAHYDYWSNKIRRSTLFEAKADILVYGMGEKAVLELADKLKRGEDYRDIRGICYIDSRHRKGYLKLPSYEKASKDKASFSEMFHTFYENNDPLTAKGMTQKHGDRYLIHNPPQALSTPAELDYIHNLDYERDVHPFYKEKGAVRAVETIRFSIISHRGCYGECSFCAIPVHQGRAVISRSQGSILKEVKEITKQPGFNGIIYDVGGPTANMYKIECRKKTKSGGCKDRRCLYPSICPNLKPDHKFQIDLLKRIRNIPKIKKVFVASGIRYDLVLNDDKSGMDYLRELVSHHISGQLKVAPEHSEAHILRLMGKPAVDDLLSFKKIFDMLNRQFSKRQFLTYYFIAAHPGCVYNDMKKLKIFCQQRLRLYPEQVQIFTPTPSTYSTLMYYTGIDPFSGKEIFVEKDMARKEKQKGILKPY